MNFFKQSSFNETGIRSLCWRGDQLVDWVGGGKTYSLDGVRHGSYVSYSYRFDAATASPDGHFAVIYEKLGTKGLLLHDGKILRELNRSFYYADAYEYPVALFNAPDGRVLLAHCPKEYCRLELEDAETGQQLTASTGRKPPDFFHSRLAASPNGKRLLSAGWFWSPVDVVAYLDVAQSLADPCQLNQYATAGIMGAEEAAACWLDDVHLVRAASDEVVNDADAGVLSLPPRGLAVFDTASQTCLRAFQLDELPGTIMAVGKHHVLALYRHPRLINLENGQIVHTWSELNSGHQVGSILWHLKVDEMPPPMAYDPASQRFAIANGDTVTVLEFDLAALGD